MARRVPVDVALPLDLPCSHGRFVLPHFLLSLLTKLTPLSTSLALRVVSTQQPPRKPSTIRPASPGADQAVGNATS